MSAQPLLDSLKAVADRAAMAETAFRRDSAQRIKALERERAFAFRKLNLMRAVAAAVAAPEKDDEAIAVGVAALKDELGWVGTSEARAAVLDRFTEVARAVRAAVVPQDPERDPEVDAGSPPPDPLAALESFETWYAGTHPVSFWALFEQYVRENPLVDF
jgi:hypothetical protein